MEIVKDSAIIPGDPAQSNSGSWILPILRYIQHGEIPTGQNPKAFKVKETVETTLGAEHYSQGSLEQDTIGLP